MALLFRHALIRLSGTLKFISLHTTGLVKSVIPTIFQRTVTLSLKTQNTNVNIFLRPILSLLFTELLFFFASRTFDFYILISGEVRNQSFVFVALLNGVEMGYRAVRRGHRVRCVSKFIFLPLKWKPGCNKVFFSSSSCPITQRVHKSNVPKNTENPWQCFE